MHFRKMIFQGQKQEREACENALKTLHMRKNKHENLADFKQLILKKVTGTWHQQ